MDSIAYILDCAQPAAAAAAGAGSERREKTEAKQKQQKFMQRPLKNGISCKLPTRCVRFAVPHAAASLRHVAQFNL